MFKQTREFIKDTNNVELFIEFPLLVIAGGLLVGGLNLLAENLIAGIALIVLSAAIVLIEKFVERTDSKN